MAVTLADVEKLIAGRMGVRRFGGPWQSYRLSKGNLLRFRLACEDGYLVCRPGEFDFGRLDYIWRCWSEAMNLPVVSLVIRGEVATLAIDPIVRTLPAGPARCSLTDDEFDTLVALVFSAQARLPGGFRRRINRSCLGRGYFHAKGLPLVEGFAIAAIAARGFRDGFAEMGRA